VFRRPFSTMLKTIWIAEFGLLVSTVLIVSGATSAGSSPLESASERFNSDVETLQRRLLIPGIALAVFSDNGSVIEYGDGYADVGGKKVSRTTLFPVASLTKTMAAVRILQLVESHHIALDDRVSRYTSYPDLASQTTVRNLMSHTSDPPPGTRFLYSGHLYGRLAAVAESATHTSFRAQLQGDVFAPARMESTYDNLDDVPRSVAARRLAKPYVVTDGHISQGAYPTGPTTAASGVVSDVDDLVRYAAAVVDGKLLMGRSTAEMFTPFRLRSGAVSPYGLGWFVTSYAGQKIVWGYGQETAFSALLLYAPQQHLGTVLLANSNALSDPFWLIFGNLLHSPFAVAFLRDLAFPNERLSPAYLELDMGFADAWLGDNKKAAEELSDALRLLPPAARNDPAVLAALARSDSEPLLKVGARVAETLLAADANNPRTRFDYAVLLVRTKQFNSAARLLRPLAEHSDPSLTWIQPMAASMLRRLPASH
jgi:CubicO group peptidase (beta-lactamase class C family)